MQILRPDMAAPRFRRGREEEPAGAGQAAPAPLPVAAGPMVRRARSWRRVGWLVGWRSFFMRRRACGGCEYRRAGDHPGVWGCAVCTGCGGTPDRMLSTTSVCKHPQGSRWRP